ncbi:MAG: hypothetical protein WBA68_03775 [Alteraurantiacibacter sp.]
MSKLLILAPVAIPAVETTRGTGGANLLTADPREAWSDDASGTVARFRVDLQAAVPIDTVFLGHATPLPADAFWTISGGAAGYEDQVLSARQPMRAVDSATNSPDRSHGLWHGSISAIRYLQIDVEQPAGAGPLSIGTLLIGAAFSARFNKEWGSGRRVIDTGKAVALQSGGFAIEPGKRKGSYSWTFGDLDADEVDALYEIQLQCGSTVPLLVIEEASATTGQLHRLHFGLFTGLKSYKRRNAAQTRWEMEFEDWG